MKDRLPWHIPALALGTVLLMGCIGPREMLARHQTACRAYGFTPGTEGYANCLLYLDAGDHGFSHHGRRLAIPMPRQPALSGADVATEQARTEPRRP